jgi:ribonucleoside-diphosphate reductase alpha chain
MQIGNSTDLAPSLGASASRGEKEENQIAGVEAPEQRSLFVHAERRKLPDERKSITHKFAIGAHEGYIIVGMYEGGRPGEIFIKMAKEGSTLSGFMDGLALSISIGLQYGVRWHCRRLPANPSMV